jgi:uncharacterized membrane protein YhhN
MDNEFYVATICVIYFPLSNNMYICWRQGVYRMLIVNIELLFLIWKCMDFHETLTFIVIVYID